MERAMDNDSSVRSSSTRNALSSILTAAQYADNGFKHLFESLSFQRTYLAGHQLVIGRE